MKEKKVAVFLADGFEEVEAITPVDLLQRAGINVDTVSITSDNLVESARKVKIMTDKVIGKIDFLEYDMLVMPGGPGTGNYFKSQLLLDNVLKLIYQIQARQLYLAVFLQLVSCYIFQKFANLLDIFYYLQNRK